MSLQKKSIFSENKLALQTLTPTYSKFNCQPLTETSQQSNVFFFKDSLSQNSKFLKNFKSKHLNIATPTVNSFIDTTGSREIPIHPFRLNDIQESELSDRNIAKIMKHNDVIAFKNKAKDTNSDTNPFSFEMIETLEDQNPHKTTNKANAPFYKSLSPSKVYKTLKLQNKENKCLIDSVDLNGVKEKNSKIMKMSLRKKSEVFECDENEKEEFSASKNLLHSSRFNKMIAAKQKEEEVELSFEEKKIKNLELENLTNELEKTQNIIKEKDSHFNDLISVKEQYKRRFEVSVEYTEHLKNVNLKLLDQINTLIKTKMIGKSF